MRRQTHTRIEPVYRINPIPHFAQLLQRVNRKTDALQPNACSFSGCQAIKAARFTKSMSQPTIYYTIVLGLGRVREWLYRDWAARIWMGTFWATYALPPQVYFTDVLTRSTCGIPFFGKHIVSQSLHTDCIRFIGHVKRTRKHGQNIHETQTIAVRCLRLEWRCVLTPHNMCVESDRQIFTVKHAIDDQFHTLKSCNNIHTWPNKCLLWDDYCVI